MFLKCQNIFLWIYKNTRTIYEKQIITEWQADTATCRT